jgi:hypothetical protein
MSDPTEEAKWRAEFDQAGETEVRDGSIMSLSGNLHFNGSASRTGRARSESSETYTYVRWPYGLL